MGTQMNESIELELDTLKIKGDPTKLYDELAKAQAEFIPVPKKNQGQVGQQKFNYAGYAALMRCVRPALSAHGITILQPLHWREDMAITTTILAGHGCSIQSSFAFKSEFSRKQKDGTVIDDPQEFGRHHTYYRRYQLQAMLGIEGDADADDLPDVNESRESAQFVEVSKVTGKPVEASPPKVQDKVQDSVEKKPAPVKEQKTNGSAKPSEPTTVAAESPKATETQAATTKTINELITAGIKELGWELPDVQSFYKEHVDPAGYTKTANLTIDQKRSLFKKMVEVRNVTPF
jgi:hypothetical protein